MFWGYGNKWTTTPKSLRDNAYHACVAVDRALKSWGVTKTKTQKKLIIVSGQSVSFMKFKCSTLRTITETGV